MLSDFLAKLDFTEKERAIYIVLAELGVQPASVVARRCNLDRVTTYKHLKKLSERGFLKTYFRDGVQCFGVESFDALQSYLQEGSERFSVLLEQFPTALNILKSLRSEEDMIPKLQVFEGDSGMKSLFRDMLFELKSEEVKQIRILSANTFEDSAGDEGVRRVVEEFFEDLGGQGVEVEIFEATGGLVPERVRGIPFKKLNLKNLPIARGSTAIVIVGHTVYLLAYKGGQVGLKFKQGDLSQIFHFLFDFLGKSS